MTTKTAGQNLADTLRSLFHVGTRTRRYGKVFGQRTDLHEAMLDAIRNNAWYPGYYSPATTEALRPGFAVASAHQKHIGGYRVSGETISHINSLSAYQFAALLGRMVDAGVTNVGEGETFYANLGRELRTAA